jgi:hypothetical protein
MICSTESSPFNRFEATPEKPLCRSRRRPDRNQAAGQHRRNAGRAREAHAVAEDGVAERKRGEGRERVAADVGRDVRLPMSRSTSLIAANTGRSGRPTQKFGGRGGSGAPSSVAARAPRPPPRTSASRLRYQVRGMAGEKARERARSLRRYIRRHQ